MPDIYREHIFVSRHLHWMTPRNGGFSITSHSAHPPLSLSLTLRLAYFRFLRNPKNKGILAQRKHLVEEVGRRCKVEPGLP